MQKVVSRAAFLAGVIASFYSGQVWAETHPAVPLLSSRPGAAYTLYLDFGGFAFTGTWGFTNRTPGTIPAYGGATSSFSTSQINDVREIWARTAEKYSSFNINVTTVDPAATADSAGTDKARQAYYEATPRMMHSVVGIQENTNGSGGLWYGSAGGVSYLTVARNAYSTAENSGAGRGMKTNWAFTGQLGSLKSRGEAVSHEDGHALGLSHQADFLNGVLQGNGYSTNGGVSGNGSVAPIMGVAYSSQRGVWRIGNANNNGTPFLQNDVVSILGNPNMGNLIEDGIGHTFATASLLPLSGSSVNFNQAEGIITPMKINGTYDAFGQANYTKDFFQFRVTGGPMSLTLWDGAQNLTPGIADPGATLNGDLTIFDINGNLVGDAIEAANTLSETFSANLAAGTYYAQVTSNGGWLASASAFAGDNSEYYSMGSYFLTGSGFVAVPEPMMLGVVGVFVLTLVRRRT